MVLHGILLERDSRLSLRRQLVGHLEARILGGQIGAGRRLPSLRRAQECLGLHRNTIAAAYRDLANEGLVRTRPGSGAYVRPAGGEAVPGLPCVIARGPRELELTCGDPRLAAVLRAELERGFPVRVRIRAAPAEAGTMLRLAPSVAFCRTVRSLPRPAVVAVISRSEIVHRLASIAVLLNGGEQIGYLPVTPGDRRDVDRVARVARVLFADHAALPTVLRPASGSTLPLPVISAVSLTAVGTLLHRLESAPAAAARPSGLSERSRRTGVHVP